MKFVDHEVRIRYGETDGMGISYYANYFVWFEAARSELFRQLGLPYKDIEAQGIFLPVIDAYCKYMQSTLYDDLIYIRVSVSHIKLSMIKFSYQVLNQEKNTILSWGYTTHAFVDNNQKTRKAPDAVNDIVTLYALPEKEIDA